MTYTKNGQIFSGRGSVVIGDARVFNPSAEQLLADGWAVYTPPAPPVRPKRYSRIKLFDALGEDAWNGIIAQLPDKQKTRVTLANEFSMADAAFSAMVETLSTTLPNAVEILAEAEI